MQRYARLPLDCIFKKFFGTEANKPLPISLLNDFPGLRLALPEPPQAQRPAPGAARSPIRHLVHHGRNSQI